VTRFVRAMLVVGCLMAHVGQRVWAQETSPGVESDGPAMTLLPHDEQARWWLSGQLNLIEQGHGAFASPYDGAHSLRAAPERTLSRVLTLYTGIRAGRGWEAILDIESAGGRGLSDAFGLAGFTDLDVVRNPSLGSAPYLARLFVRKIIALSSEQVNVTPGPLALTPQLPARRLEIRAGKLGIVDFFDVNSTGSDSHLQFTNWTVDNNGAYDYAADTRDRSQRHNCRRRRRRRVAVAASVGSGGPGAGVKRIVGAAPRLSSRRRARVPARRWNAALPARADRGNLLHRARLARRLSLGRRPVHRQSRLQSRPRSGVRPVGAPAPRFLNRARHIRSGGFAPADPPRLRSRRTPAPLRSGGRACGAPSPLCGSLGKRLQSSRSEPHNGLRTIDQPRQRTTKNTKPTKKSESARCPPALTNAVLEKHRRMRNRPGRNRAGDDVERSRHDAPLRRGQRAQRGNQPVLHRDRSAAEHTPPRRGQREAPTPAIVAGDHPGHEPAPDQPLDDHRNGALMRVGQRRDVVHRRLRMLGNALQREQLRAGEAAAAAAVPAQRLNDAPERVEGGADFAPVSGSGGPHRRF